MQTTIISYYLHINSKYLKLGIKPLLFFFKLPDLTSIYKKLKTLLKMRFIFGRSRLETEGSKYILVPLIFGLLILEQLASLKVPRLQKRQSHSTSKT